uniref:Uncharacterized protein n=1 Tax=Rhizophora mucronata TaxID=61149 RepID=A0A2P2Q3I0_RHIMU
MVVQECVLLIEDTILIVDDGFFLPFVLLCVR